MNEALKSDADTATEDRVDDPATDLVDERTDVLTDDLTDHRTDDDLDLTATAARPERSGPTFDPQTVRRLRVAAAAALVLVVGMVGVLIAPRYLRPGAAVTVAGSTSAAPLDSSSLTEPLTTLAAPVATDAGADATTGAPQGTSGVPTGSSAPGGSDAGSGSGGGAGSDPGVAGGAVTAKERLRVSPVSPVDSGAGATRNATGTGLFGIAAGSSLPALSNSALNNQLNGMAALGARWVRFDVEWMNVQAAGPSSYYWADYDRVVNAVVARGLQPLVILNSTPPWARSSECTSNPFCKPRDAAEFANFAAAAVARYKPRGVRNWEIWNEQNISQYYAPRPDPAHYTGLLKASYARIKAADPGATVLTGGTSATATAPDGSTVRATDFLISMYAAGAKGSFDAVAHHPYTYPYSPQTAFPGSAWDDLTNLHSIMAARGDGSKKVWATEYGAPTGGTGRPIDTDARIVRQAPNHVSEALQAIIIQKAISQYRTYSFVGPLMWYAYQDSGTGPTVEDHFGVVRSDGSAKPGSAALKAAFGA